MNVLTNFLSCCKPYRKIMIKPVDWGRLSNKTVDLIKPLLGMNCEELPQGLLPGAWCRVGLTWPTCVQKCHEQIAFVNPQCDQILGQHKSCCFGAVRKVMFCLSFLKMSRGWTPEKKARRSLRFWHYQKHNEIKGVNLDLGGGPQLFQLPWNWINLALMNTPDSPLHPWLKQKQNWLS